MPRMRGRLYSSCASSTWSFPSARHGVLGEDVEDQLRPVDHARSARPRGSAAGPGRARRRRAGSRPRPPRTARFSSSSLPLPTYVRCAGRARCCTTRADRLDAGGARELLDLGELVVGVCSLSQNREDEPALRLRGTWDHRPRLCPSTRPKPPSPRGRSRWSTSPRPRARRPSSYRYIKRHSCTCRVLTTTASRSLYAQAARASRSCCSPATPTPCPAAGQRPGPASRTAPSSGSARPT